MYCPWRKDVCHPVAVCTCTHADLLTTTTVDCVTINKLKKQCSNTLIEVRRGPCSPYHVHATFVKVWPRRSLHCRVCAQSRRTQAPLVDAVLVVVARTHPECVRRTHANQQCTHTLFLTSVSSLQIHSLGRPEPD